jgi:hypothetical protein
MCGFFAYLFLTFLLDDPVAYSVFDLRGDGYCSAARELYRTEPSRLFCS